jgi:hypothetical protein
MGGDSGPVNTTSPQALGQHSVYGVHGREDGALTVPQFVLQASTRVSDDFLENLLGHRSGIGATGVLGSTFQSGERSIGGPQNTAPAYGALTVPPSPRDDWNGQQEIRGNLENF